MINNNMDQENVYIFSKEDDLNVTLEGSLCIQENEIYFETKDNVYFYQAGNFIDSLGIVLIVPEYEKELIKILLKGT